MALTSRIPLSGPPTQKCFPYKVSVGLLCETVFLPFNRPIGATLSRDQVNKYITTKYDQNVLNAQSIQAHVMFDSIDEYVRHSLQTMTPFCSRLMDYSKSVYYNRRQ